MKHKNQLIRVLYFMERKEIKDFDSFSYALCVMQEFMLPD